MAVYRKNFLTNVVFRIDFEDIELGQLSVFAKKINKLFPIFEQKELNEGSLMVDAQTGKFEHSHNKKIYWQFFNTDKSKQIEITNNSITIVYLKYKDSKVLLTDVKSIFSEFISFFNVKTIKKIGLRYKNEITIKERNLIDWRKYIDSNLSSDIEFINKNKMKPSRILSQMVFRAEDAYITFNYGLLNKDYPNEILGGQFLLDYDCVSKFPIESENLNIVETVKIYNKYIEDLFESSITEKMRIILNKK